MPHQETSHRFQTAVLWAVDGVDAYGQSSVAEPIEITVRWETGKLEVYDAFGNVSTFDAVAHVDRDIEVNSRMWLGSLVNWVGTGSNDSSTEVMRVSKFYKIPDIKNRAIRRTVGLLKYKNDPE